MTTRLHCVSRLRRSLIFQPIAAMLAVLLAPSLSWFESTAGIPLGATARSFQATAQVVVGCGTGRGNKIIQNVCVNGTPYNSNGDLDQLEADAVSAYLTEHNLPASDAGLIYTYGRTDLRDAIRANMLIILLAIISKPANTRTQHETTLYNWLQALVQQNEIALYTEALAEYQKWQNDPCDYQLVPEIAKEYGLSYNGLQACLQGSIGASGTPYVPAAAYFTAVGLENSYGKSAQVYPNFASLVTATQLNEGEIIGISAAIGGVLAAASAGTVAAFFSTIVPFAFGALAPEIIGFTTAAFTITTEALGTATVAFAAGGPAAIVIVCAVAAGVDAYMVFQNQNELDAINKLNDQLANVKNNPPDLNAFATDTSGLGMTKLEETLVAQTLPDVPSTAALPAHNPGDPVFLITPNGGNPATLNTIGIDDWEGHHWTLATSGGWFDKTCGDGQNCKQTDAFSASVQYVDWSGGDRIASRFGSNFVISKASPASTDKPCPADPKTGVTPATDFSKCSNYVSNQVQYTYGGNQYTMELTNAPGFSSTTTIYFTSTGQRQNATVTGVGIPAPAISLASGSSLPAGVYFQGSDVLGNGNGQFTFLGFGSGTPGTYQVTLQAQNPSGTTTQTFTIVIATQLQIIIPRLGQSFFGPGIGAPYGQPVSFAVNTTGVMPIKLSITPGFLPPGLTFRDNGNGTAIISGTTTAVGAYPTPGCIAGVTAPTCTPAGSITATGPQGSVSLPFTVFVNPPPNPTLTLSSAIFIAGIPNSIELKTAGATTPVAIQFDNYGFRVTVVPSWLTLHDNGDGTALLSGTPPPGTSGPVFLQVCPEAVYGGSRPTLFTCGPDFQINVNGQPLFTSPNSATFTVGDPSSFTISTNEPGGSITEIGALPKGLEFTDNGNGTATISGTPAAGAGGSVTLQLSVAGEKGTGTQALNLLVNEALSFASTPMWVNFYAGQSNSFPIPVAGYPLLSSAPIGFSILNGEQYVSGAEFTVSGLPADLKYSNLNPAGYNTGTLTLSGTPSSSDVGQHEVTITATNGVDGKTITQTLILNIEAVPGDVSGDGVVTCTDLYLVKVSLGTHRGQPNYIPQADLNNDGVINIDDLAIVARNLPKGTACH